MPKPVDGIARMMYGRTAEEAQQQGVCIDPKCNEKVSVSTNEGPYGSFRDKISLNEYKITGYCQKCQDRVFGELES